MLDLEVPIIPGQSAAGYQIGMSIEAVPTEELARFQAMPLADSAGRSTGRTRYRTEQVDVWTEPDGPIFQIGVRDGYQGKLLDKIGLGMTIDALEQHIGWVALDDHDFLTLFGLEGLCFDIDWHPPSHHPDEYPDFSLPALRFAQMVWMSVFQIQETDLFPWQDALAFLPPEALSTLSGEPLKKALKSSPEELLTYLRPEALLRFRKRPCWRG